MSEGAITAVHDSGQPSEGAQRCMVDAGLLLGRSFRVGWGPNGRLVHPGEWRRCTMHASVWLLQHCNPTLMRGARVKKVTCLAFTRVLPFFVTWESGAQAR